MDAHKHNLHVRFLPNVPLGARRALRIQRRRLRQLEHVGADRQRGSVYAGEKVSAVGANIAVFVEHALYALWVCVFHD